MIFFARKGARVADGGGAAVPGYRVGDTMAWRKGFVAVLLSAVLGGCASVGNESIADASAQTVSEQLVKGKTTQLQVRQLYGDPLKSSFTDSGNESWEYEFSRLRSKPTNFIPYLNLIHSGAEGDKKTLVIFFDKRKVVQQYTISTSKVDVSQGLFTR
jgi:outer membrane protein assembly factor BamE (lipoprotein component of BamABCDE complex)